MMFRVKSATPPLRQTAALPPHPPRPHPIPTFLRHFVGCIQHVPSFFDLIRGGHPHPQSLRRTGVAVAFAGAEAE